MLTLHQDGHVVVWHDENLIAAKCTDTSPVVRRTEPSLRLRLIATTQTPGDADFPYVGKFIANLTLAQLRTVDCGSKRQIDFRTPSEFISLKSLPLTCKHATALQLVYPGTRISTLQEVFDFAECADPEHQVLWNIESKIDAQFPNRTLGVNDFVRNQHALFTASPYRSSITVCNFLRVSFMSWTHRAST